MPHRQPRPHALARWTRWRGAQADGLSARSSPCVGLPLAGIAPTRTRYGDQRTALETPSPALARLGRAGSSRPSAGAPPGCGPSGSRRLDRDHRTARARGHPRLPGGSPGRQPHGHRPRAPGVPPVLGGDRRGPATLAPARGRPRGQRERLRGLEPARHGDRLRPLGRVGPRDQALPRAPEHRPRRARAGVAARRLRSPDRGPPGRTTGTAHREHELALRGRALRSAAVLLLRRRGARAEPLDLPAERPRHLPAGEDPPRRPRRRPHQLRAVRRRVGDHPRGSDAGLPRGRRSRDRRRAPP